MTGPVGVPAKGLVAWTKEQRPGQGVSRFKQPMVEDPVREQIKKVRSAHKPSVVSRWWNLKGCFYLCTYSLFETSLFIGKIAINCQWHDWSNWNTCKGPCGKNKGTRSRTRNVKIQSANGGTLCDGGDKETEKCTHTLCRKSNMKVERMQKAYIIFSLK